MASTVQTTAVALRRGSTSANDLFTGVQGELVVDLGADGLGTDVNTTLRLHNAITQGGIPMARADMANVTSKALGTNRTSLGEKNMAYADLTNIETTTDPSRIITVLSGYGFAKDSEIETLLATYAKADMSNVNTANLATAGAGHTGKNLAYADTTNINTADLADATKHTGTSGNKPLAYADGSNLDIGSITNNFAAKDFSNVTNITWESTKANQNIESSSLKDSSINDSVIIAGHYPTTQAVVDYVAAHGGGGGDVSNKLDTDLCNAVSWDVLYSSASSKYQYIANSSYIIAPGTGFQANEEYYTGELLTQDNANIRLNVNRVDASGNITAAELKPEYGGTDIAAESPITFPNENGGRVQIAFSSTQDLSTGLYHYAITNITTVTAGGFEENKEYDNEQGTHVTPALFIKVLTLSGTGIATYKYKPETGVTNVSGTLTISSGSGTAAQITAVGSNIFPPIGGAGLAKTDFTNLMGMNEDDINAEHDSEWRIRHNIDIPSAPPANPDDDEYYRIVTAGLVAKAINQGTSSGLKNTATGSNSLTVLGTAATSSSATNIGISSKASNANATSLGTSANASGGGSTAIGKSSVASGNTSVALGAVAEAKAQGAIMLGGGVNNDAQTFKVALRASATQATDESSGLYLLLNSTGNIPGPRMALQGSAAPTTATVGTIGQFYVDTTNEAGYMCVGASGGSYTWKQITL